MARPKRPDVGAAYALSNIHTGRPNARITMRIELNLEEAEVAHLLEALVAVVDVVEQRSDELVVAVILQSVIAKILRSIEEAT
jgi:hypothetical protein